MGKTKDLGIGNKIIGRIIGIKGKCNASHEIGDKFELSCHNADGLCGFFYHDIFPKLSMMQFGGRYPWWTAEQNVFEIECPDRKNLVTLRLEIINK